MSSILASNGMVLATAMAAAVSGTVILLAFRLQKTTPATTTAAPDTQFSVDSIDIIDPQSASPRPCLSPEGKKREKKSKKRVHFAEDVLEPTGNGEEFRRQHGRNKNDGGGSNANGKKLAGGDMPANRAALYSGILRDRVFHRVGYSY